MKKITFFLTLLFCFTAANVFAADKYNYTPYFGFDYTYNHAKAHGFSPTYHAGGIHIGSMYSPYFGTELFLNQSGNDKRHVGNTKIKTSYRSYGLDLLAYLPLGCDKKISLLATTGIGEYVFKQKLLSQKHHNEHGYGYRFGGGLKFAVTQNWQARFITRYVKFDHISGYNHSLEHTFSVEYHF